MEIMQHKLMVPLSLLLLFFVYADLSAQDQKPIQKSLKIKDYSPLIRQLDSLIKKRMAQYNIKGVSISLVDDKSVILQKGFGFTDKTQQSTVNEKTLFSIQSISKTYLTTAFLMEASKGNYKLDDPLTRYYPSFSIKSRFGTNEAQKITLRQLLSHRAGFCQEAPVGSNYDTVHCTYKEHIKSISDGWLRLPVGKFYSYSNEGLDLIGFVLSKKAGISIGDYLKQNLLTPLGMNNSTYNQDEAYDYGNIAKGYYRNNELKKTYIADVAAGGLYSNAADMAKFLRYQFNDCKINGKLTISPALLTQMHTVQFKLGEQKAGYGLGIMIKPYHGATLLYHPGGGYGYSAEQAWIPGAKLGVVILTNSADGYAFNQEIFNEALEGMLSVKFGSLKADKQHVHKPVIQLSDRYLKKLTGTYKTGRSLAEIRYSAKKLLLISGSDTSFLTANSNIKFSDAKGNELIFHFNKNGTPAYYINVNQNDADFYIFNDAANDKPGANKASWRALTGTYKGYNDRQEEIIKLFMKNGYLYCSAGGPTRVSEYKPGLLFTADGESIFKRNSILYLGNRSYYKK
ncbi:serine hydrolase domain-containing protein [Mucilaginibacter sp.]|uniref:serine hydrolase domain-containing protein n=1 Tax=Mucilaginibacter sp. TaxID=1882438 RepID=UPI003D0F70C8